MTNKQEYLLSSFITLKLIGIMKCLVEIHLVLGICIVEFLQ